MVVADGGQAVLIRNIIYKCGRHGVLVDGGESTASMLSNDIMKCGTGTGRESCVMVSGGGRCRMAGNSVHNGFGAGIVIDACAAVVLTRNAVHTNAGVGLHVTSGARPQVLDNVFRAGGAAGIHFSQSACGEILGK